MAWTYQYKKKKKTLSQRVADLERKVKAKKTIKKSAIKSEPYRPKFGYGSGKLNLNRPKTKQEIDLWEALHGREYFTERYR